MKMPDTVQHPRRRHIAPVLPQPHVARQVGVSAAEARFAIPGRNASCRVALEEKTGERNSVAQSLEGGVHVARVADVLKTDEAARAV